MDYGKWHKYSSVVNRDSSIVSRDRLYSLPIVVRVEKGEAYLAADAYVAVVKLMAELFKSDRWDNVLGLWMGSEIRKVVRRARGQAWVNLQSSMDYLYVKHNNVEMMVFEPHLLDEVPGVLKKLQVQGIEFNDSVPGERFERGFCFGVDPLLGMSTGKSIAQVAHSAQMLMITESVGRLEEWFAQGCPASYVRWEVLDTPTVQVKDAGFTEIPPDSLTVKGILV